MGYALQSLLRIREMREDRAVGELTAARQVVASARDTLHARQQELEQYEATKDDRRDRVYSTVMGRTVTRDQLDLVQESIARIDEEGVLKSDNVRQAEAKLRESEEDRAVWLSDVLKEEDARAEGELEDFVVRKTDDD